MPSPDPAQQLMSAAMTGDLTALQLAILARVNVRDAADLALRIAATAGHAAVVQALLAVGGCAFP